MKIKKSFCLGRQVKNVAVIVTFFVMLICFHVQVKTDTLVANINFSPKQGPVGIEIVPVNAGDALAKNDFVPIPADVLPDRITRIQGLSWSPDGQEFVFATNREYEELDEERGDICYLWIVRVDGTNLRRITHETKDEKGGVVHHADKNPRWSPDGRRIVFDSDRGERRHDAPTEKLRQIFLYDTQSSDLKQISSGQGWISNKQPAWHPSGEQLAWVTDRNSSADIVHGDVLGRELGYLAADSRVSEFYPSWSSDGKVIAYMARPQFISNPPLHVYTKQLVHDGEPVKNPVQVKPQTLTSTADWAGLVGIASPVDASFAFMLGMYPTALWTVNLDGTEPKRWANLSERDLGADTFVPPAWSPRADRIAFVYEFVKRSSATSVEDGIYIFDLRDQRIAEVDIPKR